MDHIGNFGHVSLLENPSLLEKPCKLSSSSVRSFRNDQIIVTGFMEDRVWGTAYVASNSLPLPPFFVIFISKNLRRSAQ
jgi:hypothetical protein